MCVTFTTVDRKLADKLSELDRLPPPKLRVGVCLRVSRFYHAHKVSSIDKFHAQSTNSFLRPSLNVSIFIRIHNIANPLRKPVHASGQNDLC